MNTADRDELNRLMGDMLHAYVEGRPRDMPADAIDPNEEAIARYRLVPRLMKGARGISTETDFFGYAAAAPLLVGAFAADLIISEEGILPIARAAADLSLPLMVSEECLTPFDRITAVHSQAFLQLRAAGPLERAERLIAQTADEGGKGIMLTALAPVHPRPGLRPGGVDIAAEIARRGLATVGARDGVAHLPPFPSWNWDDVRHVIGFAHGKGLKVILKGVLDPADARQAAKAGSDAVMVSNIGVRQLYRWAPAVEQLPAVRAAAPDLPVILDGGIRNGADAIVAAALGANFACMVRPVIFSMVRGGEAGVRGFLQQVIDDIATIASWMGAESPADLGPDQVTRNL